MTKLAISPRTTNERQFQEYLSHLDRTTANQGMRALADKYGFPVAEAEGVLWTTRGYLWILLGYQSEHGLRHVMQTHGVEGRPIRCVDQNGRRKIQREIGLSLKDNESLLINFKTLLNIARLSKTDMAKQLTDYVFAQETWARREQTVQRETGHSTSQLHAIATGEAPAVRMVTADGLSVLVIADPANGEMATTRAVEAIAGLPLGTIRKEARRNPRIKQAYHLLCGEALTRIKDALGLRRSINIVSMLSTDGVEAVAALPRCGRRGRHLKMLFGGKSKKALPKAG